MSHPNDSPARPSRHRSNYPPRSRPPPTIIIVLFWVIVGIAAILIGWYGPSFIR